MRTLGIIPARYASTRFPGKPLALLGGKPIIEWVYETVSSCLDEAVVATDDERIFTTVEAFGGKAVMTSSSHRSGTDRCREAMEKVGGDFDVVINIQGDEPFITRDQILMARDCFMDPACQIATLVKPFSPSQGLPALENPNSPKVVLDAGGYAMYFSRSVIPYLRGVDRKEWLSTHTFYKHIGLYAFLPKVLEAVTRLEASCLEKAESLEQLRWIENGYRIKTAVTQEETIGIDTPEDLAKAQEYLLGHA